MAKTKKSKLTLIIVASVLGSILILTSLAFLVYLTTFHCDWGRVYNHYIEEESSYYRIEVTVQEIMYSERSKECYMYIKAPYEQHYVICDNTYQMLANSDFFDVVGEDTVITIYSHPYIAWNGWDFPIVGVEVGDKIYVDFETGKQNWLDTLKQRSEEYGFLQTPIKER